MQRKAIARSPSRQPGSSPSRSCAAALARPAQQHGAIGNQAATRRLQAKLRIAASGDRHEREADRVAAQVVAAPARNGVSNAPPHIGRVSGQPDGRTNAASVDSVLAEPGTPLQPALRHDMEQRFARDFSQVRVRSDSAAEQSARDVDARAYTVGADIVFGANRFAPETAEGRRLIAHELTHVVQQSGDGIAVGGHDGGPSARSTPNVVQREPEGANKTGSQTKSTPTLKSQGVDLKDRVGGKTADIIDEVLARSQTLAPYIGDRLKGGFKIAQTDKFKQEPTDSQFETAFREVNGSNPARDVMGFFDPKKSIVHLRPTAEFGTALHESVHRLASTGLYGTFLPIAQDISSDLIEVLKEGVTAFFTDTILSDEKLPNFNDAYRSRKHQVEALIKALDPHGFELIAKFNFQGNVADLGDRFGLKAPQSAGDSIKRTREVLTRINKLI
jgi:hypothetical protein